MTCSRITGGIVATCFTLLLAAPGWAQDELLYPDGTNASDSNTTCDATVHSTINETSPPGGTWCAADNNNTNWSFRVTSADPASSLDTGTDAQTVRIYVRQFDEGQTGTPQIRVDVYDGASCADIHQAGTDTNIVAASTPGWLSFTWTAAGLSSGNDVCFDVVCTKSGGSPSARNSCDIDSLEWQVTWAAAGEEMMVIGG